MNENQCFFARFSPQLVVAISGRRMARCVQICLWQALALTLALTVNAEFVNKGSSVQKGEGTSASAGWVFFVYCGELENTNDSMITLSYIYA
jgi:hypothetical protein